MYRLVMISINLSETAHFAHWKSKTTSETNFSDNFSDYIFLRFFLGLNFVSDYILQLYFVCNHLIIYVISKSLSLNKIYIHYRNKIVCVN